MGIEKSTGFNGSVLPTVLPGCGDDVKINCSGSKCNSLNNNK